MSEHALRREIAEVCRRLYDRFYLVATDGNVSARLGEDRILATPSGANKGFLEPSDLVVTDLEGKRLSGPGKPSSELAMHTRTYRERPDVRAVVHAHPATATAFACAGLPLDACLMTESVVGLGAVPLAPFALPSTDEVPESIAPLVRTSDVVLLANHGVLAAGATLMDAYNKMEGVEQFARVLLFTRLLGGPKLLERDQVERLESLRARYGLGGKQLGCSGFATAQPGETAERERLLDSIAVQVLASLARR
ncbi:MAG: class II aldolase/adducin family protein [Candidatus Wallbacteria bacterium]|nr:class II aldolase/adducin family protein [Candidatus Wallbacteria bacterium]